MSPTHPGRTETRKATLFILCTTYLAPARLQQDILLWLSTIVLKFYCVFGVEQAEIFHLKPASDMWHTVPGIHLSTISVLTHNPQGFRLLCVSCQPPLQTQEEWSENRGEAVECVTEQPCLPRITYQEAKIDASHAAPSGFPPTGWIEATIQQVNQVSSIVTTAPFLSWDTASLTLIIQDRNPQ